MNYKNFYKTIENLVNSKFDSKNLGVTLSYLGKYLLEEIGLNIKIEGVRLYKRQNNNLVLINHYGKNGIIKEGFKIPMSYQPLRELIKNPDGIIIKSLGDSGVHSDLEKKLGVDKFCAIEIGNRAEYVLALTLPKELDQEKNAELMYLLRTLTSVINSKIKNKNLDDIFRHAHNLQKNILPKSQPKFLGYDMHFFAKQAEEVGGDYINFNIVNDKLMFVIGDVSGHGLIPAVQAIITHHIIGTAIDLKDSENIEGILSILNKRLHDDRVSDKFMTLVYSLLDKEGNVKYANAGHNPPILFKASENNFHELDNSGIPLGVLNNSSYNVSTVKLKEKDILISYTDGIIELVNKKSRIFGESRLKKLVHDNKNKTSKELVDIILEETQKFSKRANLEDDMTIAIIKKLNVI
ncbi:MAG: PP2C family protein-serine/threonine phosphatase [Nanoarchaeota archaeon]